MLNHALRLVFLIIQNAGVGEIERTIQQQHGRDKTVSD